MSTFLSGTYDKTPDEVTCREAYLQFDNFDESFGVISPLKLVKENKSTMTSTIDVCDEYKIEIISDCKIKVSNTKLSYETYNKIKFSFDKPKTLPQIKDIGERFSHFLSLISGNMNNLNSINSIESTGEQKLYKKTSYYFSKAASLNSSKNRYLTNYSNFFENKENHISIKNFMDNFEKYRLISQNLIANMNPYVYLEHSYLQAISNCELYYSKFMKRDPYHRLITKVTAVLKKIPATIKSLVNIDYKFNKNFRQKCVQTRHDIAHGENFKQNVELFTNVEMSTVYKVFDFFTEYLLMTDIGLNEEFIVNTLKGRQKYNSILKTNNYEFNPMVTD